MLKHIDMSLWPCRCCGVATISPEFATLLRTLNDALEIKGWAVRVNCGFRCPAHNQRVGGVTNSRHMTGEAVDLHPVHPSGVGPKMLMDFINEALGVECDYKGGLGLYPWGVHMDIGKRSRWIG